MAQKVSVQLIDDIDGTEATRTVAFALDGRTYEIDLNEEHTSELEAAMEKFIAKARRVGGGTARRARSTRNTGGASGSGYDAGAVREWAKANDIEVNERGRIPKAILEQYEAANA